MLPAVLLLASGLVLPTTGLGPAMYRLYRQSKPGSRGSALFGCRDVCRCKPSSCPGPGSLGLGRAGEQNCVEVFVLCHEVQAEPQLGEGCQDVCDCSPLCGGSSRADPGQVGLDRLYRDSQPPPPPGCKTVCHCKPTNCPVPVTLGLGRAG